VPSEETDPETDPWISRKCAWSRKERALLPEFREHLRGYGSELANSLANDPVHIPPGMFKVEDTRDLEALIRKDYGKKKSIPHQKILYKLIKFLNRKVEVSIPLPTSHRGAGQEENIFICENATAHDRVHEWLKAEARWSNEWIGPNSPAARKIRSTGVFAWEIVIVSAALHGGIVSTDSAIALVDALAEPEKYFACSNNRAYADLLLLLNNGKDVLVRRWYPDSHLLSLMAKVNPGAVQSAISVFRNDRQRDRKKLIGDLVLKALQVEFKRQHLAAGLLPKTFAEFLGRVEQVLRNEISATLADYAAGDQAARSLLPMSIGRIYGDPAAPSALIEASSGVLAGNEEPERDLPEAYEWESAESESANNGGTDTPPWLKDFRELFIPVKSVTKKQILEALKEFPKELPPVAVHLRSLLEELLTRPASSGRSWALPSVKCCVLTVARRLTAEEGVKDPATSSPEELLELYRGVIEKSAESSMTSPARLQKTVAWALREYQRHIVCKFKAKATDEAVAFEVRTGILPVNARVISLDDLFAVVEHIKTAPDPNWLPKYRRYAIALTVMAFMGGVRREEGLGLVASDYLDSMDGLLLIRDNQIRELKTDNARRALYLSITAYPFTELIDYVREVFEQDQKPDGSVFTDVSEDVIVSIIHKAIEAVTGDRGCTLHSLRHSYGHYMYLRLALAQARFDLPQGLFPHLPLTTKWLENSRNYFNLLFTNGLVKNDNAWATSVEMGHSLPHGVTIPHYVHCHDLLLGMTLEHHPVFGPGAVRMLWASEKDANKSRAMAVQHRPLISYPIIHSICQARTDPGKSPSGKNLSPCEVFRKAFSLELLTAASAEPAPEETGWLRATEDALYLYGGLNMPLPAVAKSTGLDEDTIGRLFVNLGAASRMASLSDGSALHKVVAFRGSPADGNSFPVGYHLLPPPGFKDADGLVAEFSLDLGRFIQSSEAAGGTVEYFVRHMLPDRTCVVFSNPDAGMLRNCLELYRNLGFRPEQITGFSCDGTRSKSPTEKWLKPWGLGRSWLKRVVNQHGHERLLENQAEWLSLEAATLGEQRRGSDNVWKQILRYVLLMAYIRFC
jgi:integrase